MQERATAEEELLLLHVHVHVLPLQLPYSLVHSELFAPTHEVQQLPLPLMLNCRIVHPKDRRIVAWIAKRPARLTACSPSFSRVVYASSICIGLSPSDVVVPSVSCHHIKDNSGLGAICARPSPEELHHLTLCSAPERRNLHYIVSIHMKFILV